MVALATVLVATLMLSFTNTGGEQKLERLAILLAGLLALWFFARSSIVDRHLSRLIAKGLQRWTGMDASDYGQLLHLSDSYAVGELAVREGDWVADRTLEELDLREEGVVVLGVTVADGAWVGAPTTGTRIHAGERLVVYGPGHRLREIDRRRAGSDGDREHEQAANDHRETVRALEAQHTGDPTG